MTSLLFLEDKKVGLVKKRVVRKYLSDKLINAEILEYENTTECLNALEKGEIHTFVGDLATVIYSVRQYVGYEFTVANTTGIDIDYYFAVRKDMPQLVSIIDRYLSSIPEDKKKAIEHRWLNLQLERSFSLRDYWQEFTFIGTVFLLIISAIVFWNR